MQQPFLCIPYFHFSTDDLDRQTWRENIWALIQEDNNGKLTDGANGQNGERVMIVCWTNWIRMQRCGREMMSAGGVVSGWSRSAAEGDLHGDVYNKDQMKPRNYVQVVLKLIKMRHAHDELG